MVVRDIGRSLSALFAVDGGWYQEGLCCQSLVEGGRLAEGICL